MIVRTDGHIELVSREIQDNGDDNYLGDLEDLNKTFTLVLAFAAALENENLYQHIFHNLNNVLHRQWRNLPPDEKARNKAMELVKNIIAKPEMGKIYKGKVVKIMEFGAFVNFLGKQDGLVHISQLAG